MALEDQNKNAELAQQTVQLSDTRAAIRHGIDTILAMNTEESLSDSLEPTQFDVGNVVIWQLKNHPEVLVRENPVTEGETLDAQEEVIREGENQFKILQNTYGLSVVSMDSKRGKNKQGQERIFTFVDRIDGENVSKMKNVPIEAQAELESVYVGLVRHFGDAWKQNGKFWGDCRSDQFVYGAKRGRSEKHFYIVDVDSKFFRNGEDKFSTIEAALGGLCGDLLDNEQKFSPAIRLEKARKNLLQLIDEMLEKEPELQMIREARTWLLEGRK